MEGCAELLLAYKRFGSHPHIIFHLCFFKDLDKPFYS